MRVLDLLRLLVAISCLAAADSDQPAVAKAVVDLDFGIDQLQSIPGASEIRVPITPRSDSITTPAQPAMSDLRSTISRYGLDSSKLLGPGFTGQSKYRTLLEIFRVVNERLPVFRPCTTCGSSGLAKQCFKDPLFVVDVEQFLSSRREMLEAVGSIHIFQLGQDRGSTGTVFLSEMGYLITNAHVAQRIANTQGGSTGLRVGLRESVDVSIIFNRQIGNESGSRVLQISRETRFWISDAHDIAIFRAPETDGIAGLRIDTPDSMYPVMTPILVAGYPGAPEPLDQSKASLAFGQCAGSELRFDLLSLSAGTVVQGIEEDLSSKLGDDYLLYTANTTGNSSGSAIVSANSGIVLGLHVGSPTVLPASLRSNRGIRARQILRAIAEYDAAMASAIDIRDLDQAIASTAR